MVLDLYFLCVWVLLCLWVYVFALYVFIHFHLLRSRLSLHGSGCPRTCYADQAGLSLTELGLPLPSKCWHWSHHGYLGKGIHKSHVNNSICHSDKLDNRLSHWRKRAKYDLLSLLSTVLESWRRLTAQSKEIKLCAVYEKCFSVLSSNLIGQ